MLRPQREIVVRSEEGVLQEVSYRGHVPHLIDERVYRPVVRLSLASAARARRLQSGSLGTYVVYLIALVVALLAAARIGLIG
jgi:hydrogenase-4 component B